MIRLHHIFEFVSGGKVHHLGAVRDGLAQRLDVLQFEAEIRLEQSLYGDTSAHQIEIPLR